MADTTQPPTHARGSRMPVELAAGVCTATFVWQEDRWTHCVGRQTGAQASLESARESGWGSDWQSVEGPWPCDGDPRWPAAPVLVELSRVQAAGGPAIVGVGLAGRTHFSASIVPDARCPDAIRFEIAARLHETPGWLGSTYRSGGKLLRIVATDEGTAVPRTVAWSYSIGPQGIFGVVGATVVADQA